MRLRRLIQLAILLLILMATVGVWSTHDARSGITRWLLFCLSAWAFLLISQGGRRARRYAVRGLALLGVLVASGTLLLRAISPLLADYGLWVPQHIWRMAAWFEVEFPPGLIVLTLPFSILEWWGASRSSARQTAHFWLAGILLALCAIVISGSLASLLVLLSVSALIAVWFLSASIAAHSPWNRGLAAAVTTAGLSAIAASVWAFTGPPIRELFATEAVASRLELAAQSARLVGDYALVGGGLGSIPGLYAHYIRGLPVFFVPHSENLYLNVALELGLVGLIAFLILMAASALSLLRSSKLASRGRDGSEQVAAASLLAVVILGLQGLIGDPFYVSFALPLVFVIPGVAASMEVQRQEKRISVPRPMVALAALMLLFGVVFHRQTLAATWISNLAAIDMAKVELKDWPNGRWSDGSRASKLRGAQRRLEQARWFQPADRTALHRLGLIEMERRNYERAAEFLDEAHRIDPGHRGIQKALAYSLVWTGDYAAAYEILRAIPEAESDLRSYEGWWRARGRPDLAMYSAEMLSLLVE